MSDRFMVQLWRKEGALACLQHFPAGAARPVDVRDAMLPNERDSVRARTIRVVRLKAAEVAGPWRSFVAAPV